MIVQRTLANLSSGSQPNISGCDISRATASGPRRRRSSSVTYAQLKPHESITVIEELDDNDSATSDRIQRQQSAPGQLDNGPVNDYDWYDRQGMRIRVREI